MTTAIGTLQVEMIHPDLIHPNPDNPRWEAGDVTGLAQSITEDGLIQHLLVVPAPEFGPDHYMIEDGYCRWVAGKQIEEKLPCIVRYPNPDEDPAFRALITGLITDVHKTPLTAMERAKAYGRLRDGYSMTQEQIGKRCGLTASTISRYLSLLELSDKTQAAVREGRLSVDKAVVAVQVNRAKTRKKEGKKPVDVGWDPDHFSSSHHLARSARVMCDARDHNNRRRLGGACGACWETIIRADQDRVNRVQLNEGVAHPFGAPLVPITSDGAIRVNGVRGAELVAVPRPPRGPAPPGARSARLHVPVLRSAVTSPRRHRVELLRPVQLVDE